MAPGRVVASSLDLQHAHLRPPVAFCDPGTNRLVNALEDSVSIGEDGDGALVDELMQKMGFTDEEGEEEDLITDEACAELEEALSRVIDDGDFKPFPSAPMAIAWILSNYPLAPFSRSAIKLLLVGFKILKVPNAPTFYAFDKFRQTTDDLALEGPPQYHMGCSGHPVYHKSILGSLRREFLLPSLASNMRSLPRRGFGLEDIWDGSTLNKQLPLDLRTPMVRNSNGDALFLLEPVALKDGRLFLPDTFAERYGVGYVADGSILEREGDEMRVTDQEEEVAVRDWDLRKAKVAELSKLKLYSRNGAPLPLVNPLRDEAQGCDMVTFPIISWNDGFKGTSGTKGASHTAVECVNGALPPHLRDKSSSVHLFAVSKNAALHELSEPFVDEYQALASTYTAVWDSSRNRKVLIRPYPLIITGDILALAPWSSSVGHAGNKPCRDCDVYRAKDFENAQVLYDYLIGGEPRHVADTVQSIEQQLVLAKADNKTQQEHVRRSTGCADPVADEVMESLYAENDLTKGRGQAKQKKKKQKMEEEEQLEHMEEKMQEFEGLRVKNPMLELAGPPAYMDVHRRSPQDVLHTMPIGLQQELGKLLSKVLSTQSEEMLYAELEGLSMSGIGRGYAADAARLAKNLNTLNGKEVEVLSQTLPTVLACMVQRGEASQELQAAWRTSGELLRLLRMQRVPEAYVNNYYSDIDAALLNFLAALANLAPALILRYKFHTLFVHIVDNIRSLSLPRNYHTGRFESTNSLLLAGLNHTNRQAPSKDSALKQLRSEFLTHLFEGGLYGEGAEEGKGVRAGEGLLRVARESKVLREIYRLGETEKTLYSTTPTPLSPSSSSSTLSLALHFEDPKLSLPCTTFSNASLPEDTIKVDDFVLVKLKEGEDSKFGFTERNGSERLLAVVKLEKIAKPSPPSPSLPFPFILARRTTMSGNLVQEYGMPELQLEKEVGLFPLSSVVCAINVQHDCVSSGCTYDGEGAFTLEERQQTLTKPKVAHDTSLGYYVLNTCALRSAHLSWEVYPRIKAAQTLLDVVREVTGDEKFVPKGRAGDEEQ
ncbi:hypothetical protein JCM10213v2_003593 [Rhodosporidiobolus nylandii]